jgi:hypothetical protein
LVADDQALLGGGVFRLARVRVAVARTTRVSLVDDLDGGAAAGSLTFGLDGVTYELDLSVQNANALLEVFLPYLAAARPTTNPRRGRSRAFTQVATPVDPAAVRAWAASNKVPASARGRLAAATIAQYRAAGVPDDDYLPLLAELSADMSEENVGIVAAELVEGERVVAANDTAAAPSSTDSVCC